MAIEIFKLVGSILVDNEAANKSLSETDSKAKGIGSQLASGIKTAAKWGASLVTSAIEVGSKMLDTARDTASMLDEIDKASIRMGISAESYQQYAYAANLCGVETTTLEQAAKKLVGTDINFDDAIASIMAMGTEEERTQAAC